MVMLDPPVLVRVPGRVCLFPTVMLLKLRLVGSEPSAPGETPAPESPIVRVELEASEVIVTTPLALVAV